MWCVADTFSLHAGKGPCVPYISASLNLQGTLHLHGDQLHISGVSVPTAAVRLGIAQQDGDSTGLIRQQDAGILCALRGAEVKMNSSPMIKVQHDTLLICLLCILSKPLTARVTHSASTCA